MRQRKQISLCAAGLYLFLLAGSLFAAGPSDPGGSAGDGSAVSEAIARAGSPLSSNLLRLQEQLRSENFYTGLGPANRWRGMRQPGALFLILHTLSTNRAPTARQVLVSLTRDDRFNRDADRTDALILACATLRPAAPEVVAFWDQHCQPDDGFAPLTITAAVENGSASALALFEKKMLSKSFSTEDRSDWIRSSVLTHRDDPALLHSCERLLKGSLSPDLRLILVQVLFDYRPAEWFPPDNVLKPPDRANANTEARALLRKIGAWALQNLALADSDRAAIRRTIDNLKD